MCSSEDLVAGRNQGQVCARTVPICALSSADADGRRSAGTRYDGRLRQGRSAEETSSRSARARICGMIAARSHVLRARRPFIMGFQSATNAIEYCGGMLLALAPRSHVTSSIRDCEFPNEAILEAVRVGSLLSYLEAAFSLQLNSDEWEGLSSAPTTKLLLSPPMRPRVIQEDQTDQQKLPVIKDLTRNISAKQYQIHQR
jgi:hypothetical protein